MRILCRSNAVATPENSCIIWHNSVLHSRHAHRARLHIGSRFLALRPQRRGLGAYGMPSPDPSRSRAARVGGTIPSACTERRFVFPRAPARARKPEESVGHSRRPPSKRPARRIAASDRDSRQRRTASYNKPRTDFRPYGVLVELSPHGSPRIRAMRNLRPGREQAVRGQRPKASHYAG